MIYDSAIVRNRGKALRISLEHKLVPDVRKGAQKRFVPELQLSQSKSCVPNRSKTEKLEVVDQLVGEECHYRKEDWIGGEFC